MKLIKGLIVIAGLFVFASVVISGWTWMSLTRGIDRGAETGQQAEAFSMKERLQPSAEEAAQNPGGESMVGAFERVLLKEQERSNPAIANLSLTNMPQVTLESVETYLQQLDSNSESAIATIESDLAKIPQATDQLVWRTRVLQAAFNHGLASAEGKQRVSELALRELEGFLALPLKAGQQTQVNSIYAVYVRSSSSSVDAERGTLRAMYLTTDPSLQALFADEYLRIFPDRFDAFQATAQKLNLTLKAPQIRNSKRADYKE